MTGSMRIWTDLAQRFARGTSKPPARAIAKGFRTSKLISHGMRNVYETLCRKDLGAFKTVLMTHADLRLPEIFTFFFDDTD